MSLSNGTARVSKPAERTSSPIWLSTCKGTSTEVSSLKILVMSSGRLLIAALMCATLSVAQKPEYDFYIQFRNVFGPKVRAENPSVTKDEIIQKYAAKLKADGIGESEIDRRVNLLRTKRHLLEADRWNRFYSNPQAEFNRAPNAFLMDIVEGRTPGVALDYGMGEGRNSIYLAQLGWDVWGFDLSDAAVELAQKRARNLGLTLHAEAVRDADFEFGKERFDLIVFSWSMPLIPVERIIDSLKPAGMVVMETAVDFVGRNGMLKMFDALKIVRYEIVQAKADFYGRREWDVLRMVAEKTDPPGQ